MEENMTKVRNAISDPERIDTWWSGTGCFFVNDRLAPAGTEESPMQILAGFSRFEFGISKNGHGVRALLPLSALADIKDRTFAAGQEQIQLEYIREEQSGQQASATSPAYTVQIRSGNLRGKTPAQVIGTLGPEQGVKALQVQIGFLEKQNANPDNKYKASNTAQIKAMQDALRLLAAGNLDKTRTEAEATKSRLIFKGQPKYLEKKRKPNGKVKVYQMRIVWNLGMKTPVSITITNEYCPVNFQNGSVEIDFTNSEEKIMQEISLSAEQWKDVVEQMSDHSKAARITYYGSQRKRANEIKKSLLANLKQ